jgi:hypothetical protein
VDTLQTITLTYSSLGYIIAFENIAYERQKALMPKLYFVNHDSLFFSAKSWTNLKTIINTIPTKTELFNDKYKV